VQIETYPIRVLHAVRRYGRALIHSPLVRVLAGLVVSVLALLLMLRAVDLAQLWGTLAAVNAPWALLVVACVLFNQVAKTYRWRVLIGPPGEKIPSSTLFKSLMSGQLLNLIFAARIGELTRAFTIGSIGPGRAYILGTVVIEKILDIIIYLSLFVVLLVLIPLPEWLNQPVITIVLVAFFLMVSLVVILFKRSWVLKLVDWMERIIPANFQQYTIRPLRSGLASLDILKNGNSLLKVGAWSGIIWLTALSNNYLTMKALGIELPLQASLFVLVALLAGVSLPAAPGSIGVFELICVLTLGYYGVNPTLALSYGLVLHFLVVVPVVILGLFSMWSLGLSREKITAVSKAPAEAATPTTGPDGDF
jgi:glycosyltransferase 2 family protein